MPSITTTALVADELTSAMVGIGMGFAAHASSSPRQSGAPHVPAWQPIEQQSSARVQAALNPAIVLVNVYYMPDFAHFAPFDRGSTAATLASILRAAGLPDATLTTQMKSVGEVMALGLRAVRSKESENR